MAGRKENLKSLFTNSRSRIIILFTMAILFIAIMIGFSKFFKSNQSDDSTSSVRSAPGIQSIPGALNPTVQYAKLQEAQNINQAQTALIKGSSAIPTIVRSQELGTGVNVIGAQPGSGGLGFSSLSLESQAGSPKSAWLQELQNSSCSKASMNDVINQGAKLSDLKNSCSCIQLKDNGYQLADLEKVCSCQELKASGFNARQLKDAGFTAGRLRACGFDACELRNAGFSAQEMKDGGFSDDELKGAGFTPAEITRASGLPDGISEADVRNAGCDATKLAQLRSSGVTASAIRRISGCSIQQLKAAGFTAADLKNAGFTAADLKKAGFTAAQLRDAGFNARDLLNAGFSPADLEQAGFSPDQIQNAETELPPGISPYDIKKAGCDVDALRAERLAGVSATLIKKYAGCSAQALKAAGFSDEDLANAGFTPQEIAQQSASDDEIKAAGCDPDKLKGLLNKGVSATKIHEMNGCSAAQLKAAGFSAKSLIDAGFSPADLAAAGFSPEEINAAEAASDKAIRDAGCDKDKLKGLLAGGVSAKKIHELNGCTAAQLKAAGFDAQSLLAAGFSPADLAAAGFSPEQIKAALSALDDKIKAAGCDPAKLKVLHDQGVTARQIHDLNGCTASQLKAGGYDAQSLINAGFTPADLAAAGFTPAEIKAGVDASDAQIKAAGCDPDKLKALVAQGVSAKRVHDLNGCTAAQLKAAGYDAKGLLEAGFTPAELAAAGFSPQEINTAENSSDAAIKDAGCDPAKLQALRAAGVTAKQIHDKNGCSASQLKAAGYDAKELLGAGFTPQDLAAAGYTPEEIRAAALASGSNLQSADCDPARLQYLRNAGVSAEEIRSKKGCSASQLKAAGFDAKSLLNAGFSPEDLAAAGFTPDMIRKGEADSEAEIKAAGCDPVKLKALSADVSAKRIKDNNGCSDAQLLAAGFSPEQISQGPSGSGPAGFIADGRKGGCDVASLTAARNAGVSAATIRQTLGCNADALKAAGYNAAELKAAGFTAAELKKAGFNAADLKAAGYSAKELRDAGFSAKDLKDAGYSAKQLKEAGFSAADLKAAGFTASQLKDAGYSAKELKQAGFDAAALKAAGFDAEDLNKAGFSAAELEAAGYSAKDLKAAGYSNDDIKKAGYSQDELAAAGIENSNVQSLGAFGLPAVNSEMPSVPGYQGNNAQAGSSEANNTRQLQEILSRQKTQLADQKFQQQIQQRTSDMISSANQSLQNWKSAPSQAYVAGSVVDTKPTVEATATGYPAPVPQSADKNSDVVAKPQAAIIKTGDILFAVIDTSVNSDEPGPILATIVSGRLKGSKLIGSFNLPSNADKMVISFNTLSVPGAAGTVSISAYAIDANTARTALSSSTNHHYLLRYGSLFASSFMEGFGNAIQSANTTITIGGSGSGNNTTTIQGGNAVGQSTLENAVIGLATVGKAWGQFAQQKFNTPVTVEVYSGTAIGVLFTQDLTSL